MILLCVNVYTWAGYNQEERDNFWEDIYERLIIVKNKYPECSTVICGDFNITRSNLYNMYNPLIQMMKEHNNPMFGQTCYHNLNQ